MTETKKARAVVWVGLILTTSIGWAFINTVLGAPSFVGMLVGMPVGAIGMMWVLEGR
jgi:hypothetical protein